MNFAQEKREQELLRLLEVSEGANVGFDNLIDATLAAMQHAMSIRFTPFAGDLLAVDEQISSLQVLLLSGGGDGRILEIARHLLSISGINARECFIDAKGDFHRRKIYFAQRSDGAIKIGSSIRVRERIASLETACGPLKLLHECNGTFAVEAAFHKDFDSDRIHGEWFEPERILKFIEESKQLREQAEAQALVEYSIKRKIH